MNSLCCIVVDDESINDESNDRNGENVDNELEICKIHHIMEAESQCVTNHYIDENDDDSENIWIDICDDEEDEISEIDMQMDREVICDLEKRWRLKGNNFKVRGRGTSRYCTV